nr:MAG TPA: hypothetical protein [Caudoviricetes sp.]
MSPSSCLKEDTFLALELSRWCKTTLRCVRTQGRHIS